MVVVVAAVNKQESSKLSVG
uniref:Uncharacterized protein n=1 Tax=Zea mays TaxID=4577 RepID=C4J226_MAIZE|nr:unknown [Zea mays]